MNEHQSTLSSSPLFLISVAPLGGAAVISVLCVFTHGYIPAQAAGVCIILGLLIALILCATPGRRMLGVLSLAVYLSTFAVVIWVIGQIIGPLD
jgi:hypothetical protein